MALILGVPALWRETAVPFEAAALRLSATYRGSDARLGRGLPVLLIPAFLAGDVSMMALRGWLRRNGFRPASAGIVLNAGCTTELVELLEARLQVLHERHGTRVAVVGHSRGGVLARTLAVRCPELVAGIVTLGSPHGRLSRLHPALLVQVRLLGMAGTIGIPGVMTRGCLDGDCCAGVRAQARASFPAEVGFVAITSTDDRVVPPEAASAPEADIVAVRASHSGMVANAEVYDAVGTALAGFASREADRRSMASSSRSASTSSSRRP